MKEKKEFGLFIQLKRKEKGYSQKQLAEMLFVTESAISKWERGVSYPDVTLITDICKALDISEHEFIPSSTDTSYRQMKKEAKIYRNIHNVYFWGPVICYMIVLLVTFIVNLAISHTLNWFFVVVASLICAFSFIPTWTIFFKSKKLLWFLLTNLLSIIILLFTCGIYNKTYSWPPIAAVAVILGYEIIFLPVIINKYNVHKLLKKYNWLFTFMIALLLTIIMFLFIRINHVFPLSSAILLTLYAFIPFIMIGVISSLSKLNNFIKAGVDVIVSGTIFYSINFLIPILFKGVKTTSKVNFSNWELYSNGNIQLLSVILILSVGLILLSIGVIKKNKKY
ncbi:MAG: helix-turn-helix transcriptional regulator [Bacilli bacterium]|nr:helix-turn-helix transcriptional regulator [Bacilli bacterium]